MEFSMSQLPELLGLGVPVFIGCSFVMAMVIICKVVLAIER